MNPFKLSKSPFRSRQQCDVNVAWGKGAYQNTENALSAFDLSPAQGKKVLLKPNVGRLAPRASGVNAHPQVVAACIDAFKKAGAAVAVGESPITGVDTMEAFEEAGIADVCHEKNVPLINMDARPMVRSNLPQGVVIDKLQLCPDITEFDLIVSIPVMKMHMHTGVTLSVKNMKGCLWRRSKVQLHMLPPCKEFPDVKPINIAIADMAWALRPHFTVADGTVGMEGLGPGAGIPKPLNTVVAGIDPFAVDSVCCRIMGTDAKEIQHLRIGAERGYGTIDIEKLAVEPYDWERAVNPFEKPPKIIDVNFPGIHIADENSCSACQSTLLLFLKKYGNKLFDYFPKGAELTFAIGKGCENLPESTVCIGNCTFKNKHERIFVKGCPPVGSEILNEIIRATSLGEE